MDFDDLPISENDLHLMRHRPPSLSQLSRSSGFSPRQVQFLYRNFKQECPNGLMSQTSFKNVFIQLFPFGDSSVYSKLLWKMLSRANKGHTSQQPHSQTLSNTITTSTSALTSPINNYNLINFEDFLASLSVLVNGDQEQKMSWIFDFYDTDSDGLITYEDLCQTVGSIYALIGQNSSCPLGSSQQQSLQQQQQNEARSAEELNDVTRSLFRKIDLNSQGKGNFNLAYLEGVDKSMIMTQ
ncbi:A-type potassium channel modulatory protein KCNIP1-like isoform X2 [Convolutriloba macropyga]|uniref:A-type potassium channel modulatory protein KCNIP1-like isoform X2 n=1 Tax=Convolutriloba macropyga TaxID=536237 RepID=UPI003F5222D6